MSRSKMDITNYFDLKLIVNLSISISISLFVVFVLGKVASDFLSSAISILLKHVGKSLLKKYSPIKFTVGFPEDRVSSSQITYQKHKLVNFGKLNQTSLPGYGADIFIKADARSPFLYKGEKIRSLLVDAQELLGIYSIPKLPGKPATFVLGNFIFENNIVNHMHIDFKPEKLFDKYQISIVIYFQGNQLTEILEITVTKE